MNGLDGQLAARRPQVARPTRLLIIRAPTTGLVGQHAADRPQVAPIQQALITRSMQ